MKIVLNSPQAIVKDCYAAAPILDFTLRANGEEKVSVIDAYGRFSPAGFDAPTVAITVSTSASGSGFDADKYWEYRYVYVCKNSFTTVENAVTGNGSPAPRSNPSPTATANSTSNVRDKILAIPTTTANAISHIWVYRTLYFDTADLASTNSDGGVLFWIGEVGNVPGVPSVSFTDDNSQVGLEQIENDNFLAPQFNKCVFADPYFFGIGNDPFIADVSVTATGEVALTASGDKWFNGRDGQRIIFEGITTGGFDGFGTWYFKWLTDTTGQIYNDIGLTIAGSCPLVGTTQATIQGPATVLYQSKYRNPFAWGTTDLIGELQVPALNNFPVGGGRASALSTIPTLNLLKVDTESPSACYTFNLKNAGTPNFVTSKRIISDSYSVSNNVSQFTALKSQGQNVLWGIDAKNYAVVECDGSSLYPVSSPMFKTLRRLVLNGDDRIYFHGTYNARLELNCIIARTEGSIVNNLNSLFYMHAPTGYWGEAEVMDILCSADVYDSVSGELKTIVGTNSGLIGEAFHRDRFWNWTDLPLYGTIDTQTAVAGITLTSQSNPTNTYGGSQIPVPGIIGNWVQIRSETIAGLTSRWWGRIATVANEVTEIELDIILQQSGDSYEEVADITIGATDTATYAIGAIDMTVGRGFNASLPMDFKFLECVSTTWIADDGSTPPFVDIFPSYPPRFLSSNAQAMRETRKDYTSSTFATVANLPNAIVYEKTTSIPVDQSKIFGILIEDRNPSEVQLMNYELRLNVDSSNGN